MRYRNIIIGLGFFVIIIQSLGFPQSWRNGLYIVSGVLIIAGGYLSEKERRINPSTSATTAPSSSTGPLS